uniref:Uncharacterized protein n=1 Tax=Leersia perrieri TaxID=77586 RepID=A0A0D9V3H6_9ORYZ
MVDVAEVKMSKVAKPHGTQSAPRRVPRTRVCEDAVANVVEPWRTRRHAKLARLGDNSRRTRAVCCQYHVGKVEDHHESHVNVGGD